MGRRYVLNMIKGRFFIFMVLDPIIIIFQKAKSVTFKCLKTNKQTNNNQKTLILESPITKEQFHSLRSINVKQLIIDFDRLNVLTFSVSPQEIG